MGHLVGADRRRWGGIQLALADGALRRVDPRVRILAAVAFSIVVVALDNLVVLGLALGAAVLLMLAARLPARQTLKRMAAMDGFVVFMLLLLPFTVPGDPLLEVAGLVASRQGLEQAFEIALTANAVILALMALVGSMEAVTLGHALHRLRVPENLVHLLLFTVRYVEVLHQEYLRARNAMRARGFRPRNNRHTYASFGYLVGMLLVRAVERSERILMAMKSRGFTGRLVLLDTFRLRGGDVLFGGGVAALCAGLLGLEVLHVFPV